MQVKYKNQTTTSTTSHPAILKVSIDEETKLTQIFLTDLVQVDILKYALDFFYAGKFICSVIQNNLMIYCSPKFLNWSSCFIYELL